MTNERIVEFFFSPGSRCCYLAARRLPRICARTRARFDWRPVRGAHALGAFGVPTFLDGDAPYWGNERLVLLEHALTAACR